MASKFAFNGFFYRKNSKKGETIYYICSKRDSTGCLARLIIDHGITKVKGVHICTDEKITTTNTQREIPEGYIENYIDEKASSFDIYPNKIYENLLLHLRDNFSDIPYIIPSKKSVFSKIREIRGASGFSSIQAIMIPPYSIKKNGQPFYRRYWNGEVRGEYHQFLLWTTNEALSLMRYNSHTFIDCTFKSTPNPFLQCLIVMIFDQGTEIYVPTVYALLTGKSEYLYCEVFHQIIALMEYNWMPKIITTDFESGLIAAIKQEFPDSRLLGCYFHLKQAIFRKLRKYKILNSNATVILSKIELLTLIPNDKINDGIKYIQSLLSENNNMIDFWNYFQKIWLNKFNPVIWNTSSFIDQEISNRTNNALERYNRRINDYFSNAHPNLFAFVEIIRKEFEIFEQKCSETRQNAKKIKFKLPKSQHNQDLINFQEFLSRKKLQE